MRCAIVQKEFTLSAALPESAMISSGESMIWTFTGVVKYTEWSSTRSDRWLDHGQLAIASSCAAYAIWQQLKCNTCMMVLWNPAPFGGDCRGVPVI